MGLLLLLFIVVPIAEIYVIIQVGQAIGALWTIALLILDSFIGARLLRWQGRSAWRNFQAAVAAGRMPHREVLDGAMIILGGAFLLTPGFITDAFGLLLLLPPTRRLLAGLVVRSVLRRGVVTRVVVNTGPGRPPGPPQPPQPPPERRLPPG
jgi:UPF0716 protein FxsA